METDSPPACNRHSILACSLCGLDENHVSFSRRQRKKAHKGEYVKCTLCAEAGSAQAKSPAPAQIDVAESRSPDLDQAVPRKKRKLAHSPLLDDEASASDDGDDDSSPGECDQQVSLDAIKREVLGRDHLHIDTPGKTGTEDDDLARIRELLEARPEPEQGLSTLPSVAERLQPDLECAICRDLLYPPVSLQCGHSFCQDCLEWWWKTSPTCPTCRGGEDLSHTRTSPSTTIPKVNFALKKCIMALYAPLVVKKIQTRKNVTTGENSGAHGRGCEVLSPLEDEFWHSITTSISQTVKVRRNIMLDEDDQRMQVAMGLYQPPVQLANGIILSLCLLTMEEDEASDSGFPTIVTNMEDQHFICTGESKFRQSLLLVEMTKEDGSVAPVARVSPEVMPPGMVEFQFDASTCTFHEEAMALRFKHEDTGAVLEIDLSLLKRGAGGGSFLPLQERQGRQQQGQKGAIARQRNCVVMDDAYHEEEEEEEEEGEDLDEFEEDGFLVGDDTSDVEGNFSGDEEENDLCSICRDGGDLMICDGGREMEGCGKSFHIECVDRESVPEGDWICSPCARSGGIQVEGNIGHEFLARSMFAKTGHDSEPKAAGTGTTGRTLDDDSSLEEDTNPEKSSKAGSAKNKPNENKRRIVLEDSDDE